MIYNQINTRHPKFVKKRIKRLQKEADTVYN